MRNSVVYAIVIFLVVPVRAMAVDARRMCSATANIAKAAMEHRQLGKPYSSVITLLDDTDTPKNLQRLYITFTDLAYFEPRYKSRKKQQKAVNAFRDNAFSRCIEEFSATQSK